MIERENSKSPFLSGEGNNKQTRMVLYLTTQSIKKKERYKRKRVEGREAP